MAEIKQTAPGVWLVNLYGRALASESGAHVVYHYDSGLWQCESGATVCPHIEAVKDTMRLHVWSGDWKPQGTPERPYAHTEEYIRKPNGEMVILTTQSISELEAQGYILDYPVKG